MAKEPHFSTVVDPGKNVGFSVGGRMVNAWNQPFEEEEDEEGYGSWSPAQLKTELANRDLAVTGKKADLIARLEEDDEAADDSDEESEVDEDGTED